MKYIIMAAGKGTRWNNYLGITKQEAIINNESILERIVRLIKEYDKTSNIIISSENANHVVNNTLLHKPIYADKYRHKYLYELINEPILYLYGDTFYEKDSINKILEPNDTDILFYGNPKAIVGLRVNNFELFKNEISLFNGDNTLYKYLKKQIQKDDIVKFMHIGNEFYNINYGKDYEQLKEIEELLFFNNKLLCNGIIWNIGFEHKDSIINDLKKYYQINNIDLVSAENYMYDLFLSLYEEYMSKVNIDIKYSLIKSSVPQFVTFDFGINNPHFELQKEKNQIACSEVTKLKKEIRDKYKLQMASKYDNVIHITDTPIEYLNNRIVISNFIEQSKIKVLKKYE